MAIEEEFRSGTVDIARRYGERIVEELRERFIEGGEHGPKLASGSLIGGLTPDAVEVQQDATGRTVVRIVSEDYLRYVDRGRRPGKFPPISKIREWTRQKLIPERAAFPIARKIAEEGIEGMFVLNPTIDAVTGEFLPEYEKEMAKIVGVVLKNDVFSNTTTKGRIVPKTLR